MKNKPVQHTTTSPNKSWWFYFLSLSMATASALAAPTVNFTSASQSSTDETGTMTITAQLSASTNLAVTVPFTVNGSSTAALTDDYTITGSPLTIPAFATSADITITIVTDVLDEDNETVIVNMGTPVNATQGTTIAHTATITDDDAEPSVTLAVDNANIAEASGVATFTATLSAVSGRDVTVNLDVTGTATGSGTDYTLAGSPIVISAGNLTGTATVTADQDTLDENNETVIVDIDTVDNGTESGSQSETTTITDDDATPTVTFTTASQSSTDETGTMTITAQLSAASGLNVTVPFTVNGSSTATLTEDYTISGSPITITAGATTADITINIVTEVLDEDNETVIVNMGTPVNANQGATSTHTATITDDDAEPSVTLAVNNANIAEASGVATFTATLSAVSGRDVTVNLDVTGTATGSGTDYTLAGSPIVISAGNLTGTATVTAAQDLLNEGNETVIIDIDSVVNGTESGAQSQATTITDDDAQPTVTFTTASQASTGETGTMTITAQLSAASGLNVTVPFTVNGSSTATLTDDYTITGSPLTITAGATTADITITIATDVLDEDNETVVVNMGTPVNANQGATTTHTATITDDDAEPSVTLAVNNANIAEASGVATFTATLSALSGRDVTVNLDVTGTATGSGTDYTLAGSPIVITAGNLSAAATVTANQDLLNEGNETVIIDIDSVVNGTESGAQSQTTTITDDDAQPTVTFTTASQASTGETGTMTITAQLSAASGLNVTAPFTVNGSSTATLTDDYTITGSPITITAGATTADITITIATDVLDEDNETVIVNMGTPVNATQGATIAHTATITDDDAEPSVTLAVNNANIAEASGVATFTATLSAVSGRDVTVNLDVTGTATGGSTDYTLADSPILISAGNLTGTATVTADQDLLDEDNETVIIDIDSVVNGTESGAQSQTTTITDDDTPPTVTFTTASQSSTDETGTMTITAQLSTASGRDVDVPFTVNGSSTATLTDDFTISGSPITITEGSTTADITITIVTDALDEVDETVIVDMGTPVNATQGATTTHTATITDDDNGPSVTLSVDNANIAEASGVATFTATLNAISGLDVTVNLDVTGTATGGSTDYTLIDSPIVISAGNLTGTATVTADQDLLDEDNETVIVDIDSVDNGTESGVQSETTTITDDDATPTVTFTTASQSSTDETGTMTITAQLSAVSGRDVDVPFTVNGSSTATLTDDYTISGSPITITAGATTADITITIATDVLDEDNETVVVNMGTPVNANQGATTTHTATITDDDAEPSVTLAVNNANIAEASGVATFTATLSALSGRDVTVNLDVTGTATGSGTDYTLAGSPIVITAGNLSAVATVTANQDLLNEGNETVIIDIDSVVNGTESGAQSQTTTITDDDAQPTVTFTTASQASTGETGTMTITAQLSAASGLNVTAPFTVNGSSTATLTDDYTITGSPITITAGATTADITITIATDVLDEDNETVIVNMGTPVNATQGATIAHTATITDDDAEPSVTLAVNNANIAEASGVATFTATLSAVSGRDVTVNLDVTGTATGGSTDYTLADSPILISAGNLTGTATVTADQDLLDEDNETVIIDIDSVVNGTESGAQSQTTTITDDDTPPTVTFTTASQSSTDETGTMTITAQLSTASGRDVDVPFTVNGSSTATLTDDFTISGSPITITEGSTTADITITIVTDALDEVDETVIVNMGTPVNATQGATTTHTATITDDDNGPSVTLSVDNANIAEASGVATFTATLNAISGLDVTVNLDVTGTATGGSTDYTLIDSPIVISAGNLTGTATVTADQDLLDEDNETVIVDIDSVDNGTESGVQSETTTITDDDATPTVTFTTASQSSTDETGTMTITAQLSAVSGRDVDVPFTVNGSSTATLTDDYTISGSPITITAGATTADITITIATDVLDEDNETVVVNMGTPVNANQGATTTHTATITDDDAEPSVTLAVNNANIAEASGVATFTATLSALSGRDVTVNLDVTGTATGSGTDYTLADSPIVITAGNLSAVATVTANQDLLNEGNETVIIDIDSVVNGTESGAQSQTTTITDDDAQPTVTFTTASQASTGETGTMTITAQLSAASGLNVTAPFTVNGSSTATLTDDYTITGSPITITAGATTADITITIATDVLDEDNETVIVNMGTPVNATQGATIAHTATITDDDAEPSVTLAVNNANIAEASGVATFTATLSAVSGRDVTVNLDVTGTATGGSTDYTLADSPIVISAGNLTGTATVTADQDLLDEDNETVIIDIDSVVNGTESGAQSQTTTITDDDTPPTVTFTTASQSSTDETGTMTITAQLSAVSGRDVDVPFTVNGSSTATLTDDYTISGSPITITEGSTTADITITIATDVLDEDNETVIVDMGTPVNATQGATTTHTATITDDDAEPSVTLAVNNANIAEASGVATFTATLSAVSGRDVTVNLDITGTATGGGTDYTLAGSPIVILAGNLTGTATVTADQDVLDEDDETVIVDIDSVTNGTESGSQQETTTINDDDFGPDVTLSVDNATIVEASGVATFTATLSEVSGLDVTVTLGFSGGATGGSVDYTVAGNPIVITAGTLTGTATVTADQDVLDEDNETVVVDIATVDNGIEDGTQQETTAITDDDTEPNVTLAVDNATIAEASGVATFTATLDAVSGRDVTVNLGFTGSATGGSVDYTVADSPIVILAGNLTGTATVTADQDLLDEDNETVIVDIASVINGTETGSQQASTAITDDDTEPNVSLSVDTTTIAEASGVATFTATLDAVSGRDVTVNLDYAVGSAIEGTDFTPASTFILITAGNLTGMTTVTADQDLLDEDDEFFRTQITTVINGNETGTQQQDVTITDDDIEPTVTLTLDNPTIVEAGGIATFTATLDAVSGRDVTVNLALTGTATGGGTDYTLAGSPIVISEGTLSASATVTADQDVLDEDNETVIVDISSVDNGTESGTQSETTTITDDDPLPTVIFTSASQSSVDETGTMTITAEIDAVSGRDVTVPFTIDGLSTALDPTDYTITASPITITEGSTTATITITIAPDAIDENNETIIVNMGAPVNATQGATTSHTATITDDDDPPTVQFTSASQTSTDETGTMTITAELSTVSGLDVTLPFTIDGLSTAIDPDDYTITASPVLIPAGSTTVDITITIVEETLDENDETVIVNMGTPINATQGVTTTHTATITDDDIGPLVSLSLDNANIPENGGVATVTATLDAVSGLDVTVNLLLSGTATGGSVDYTSSSLSLLITAGNLTGTLTITGDDDALDEDPETVIVDIDTVVNGAEDGTQQVTTTIDDDDPTPSVTLSIDNATIAEASGVATVTATLSAVSGRDVTVDLAFTGAAVIGGVDYTASNVSILIPEGSSSAFITITADQDTLDENNEDVIIDIDTILNGIEAVPQTVSTTIIDDDPPPTVTLSLADDPMAENGGVATVTATLDTLSGLPVTVNLVFAGTALNIDDYTRSAISILVPAGQISADMTLTAVQDAIYETDETVIVDIDTVVNGTEDGTQQVTATITDDETQPTVSLSVITSPIDELGGSAIVRATLSGESAFATTVNYTLSGDATLTDDYTITATSVIIPAGSLTGDVTVNAVDDTIFEPNEQVLVDIDSVVNATEDGVQQASVVITDDEPAPIVTLTLDNSTIPENAGVATFTITQDRESAYTTIIDLGLTGTATDTDDFTKTSLTVTIPAGSFMTTFVATAVQDLLDEFDETIIVDITSVVLGMEVGTEQETTTITDDDPPAEVSLILAGSPFDEDGGTATVTAALDTESGKDITVNLTYGGTAGAGDYSTSHATSILIPAGSLSAAITLTGIDDCDDDDSETVIIDIDTVTNGLEFSPPQQVTATITDDDITPTDLAVAPTTINENNSVNDIIGALTTTDGNPLDTHIYTLVAGAGSTDNASFNILGTNLRATDVFNFEVQDTYSVRIRTTDPCLLFYEEIVTITIGDINDAPVINDDTFDIDENSPNTTIVDNTGTTDEDDTPVQTLSFNITAGDPTSIFSIDTSGNIRVADVSQLNFEATSQYILTIEVMDDGSPILSDTATIVVDVNNVNETPVMNVQAFALYENTATGINLYDAIATDPDILGPFAFSNISFTITGGAADPFFDIDAAGNVTIADYVDFETDGGSLGLNIRVQDDSGLLDDEVFTVTVNPVDPKFFDGLASVSSANATLEWDTVENVLYDVYTSTDNPGDGMTWAKIVDEEVAVATSTVVNASSSEDRRYFLVVDRADPVDTNAMWGVIRNQYIPIDPSTTQAGFTMSAPPIESDRAFDGDFGLMLSEGLVGDNAGINDGLGDEVMIYNPTSQVWDVLYLDEANQWRESNGSLSTRVVPKGRGYFVLNNSNVTTKNSAFIGRVGNKLISSIEIVGGEWNMITLSEGAAMPLDKAFSQIQGGKTLTGSFDETQADLIVRLTLDGTFRRHVFSGDNTWRSLDPDDFGQLVTEPIKPGESFYFFRHISGGDMTIDF